MSGKYENRWKEAMSGASVQPSDSLWDSISSSMDTDRGRNNWITILLVAATVTVAFAFPLTVGNSSFEARPEVYDQMVQSLIEDQNPIDTPVTEKGTQLAGQVPIETPVVTGKDNIDEEKYNLIAIADKVEHKKYPGEDIVSANLDTSTEVESIVKEADPLGLNLHDSFAYYPLKPSDLEQYYLIPYYLSPVDEIGEAMLASINLGRGSASGTGGGSGFAEFLSFAAMDEAPSDLTDGNRTSIDNRYENSGTTSYFGAALEIPLGKRLAITAGLGYLAQKATGMSNVVIDDGINNKPISAYDPIEPGAVFLSDSYEYSVLNNYLNIPVTLKYPFINKKIKVRTGLGISTDIMLSHRLNSSEYGSAKYKPAEMEYKPVIISGLVNLDVSYSITSVYGVAFELGARKGLSSIDQDRQYYPSSFTAGIILSYRLQ